MTDVEKAPAFGCIPLFARVAGVELLQIAAIAEPVRIAAGETVLRRELASLARHRPRR